MKPAPRPAGTVARRPPGAVILHALQGRVRAAAARRPFLDDTAAKLATAQKLSIVLQTTKGISNFSPPPAVLGELLASLAAGLDPHSVASSAPAIATACLFLTRSLAQPAKASVLGLPNGQALVAVFLSRLLRLALPQSPRLAAACTPSLQAVAHALATLAWVAAGYGEASDSVLIARAVCDRLWAGGALVAKTIRPGLLSALPAPTVGAFFSDATPPGTPPPRCVIATVAVVGAAALLALAPAPAGRGDVALAWDPTRTLIFARHLLPLPFLGKMVVAAGSACWGESNTAKNMPLHPLCMPQLFSMLVCAASGSNLVAVWGGGGGGADAATPSSPRATPTRRPGTVPSTFADPAFSAWPKALYALGNLLSLSVATAAAGHASTVTAWLSEGGAAAAAAATTPTDLLLSSLFTPTIAVFMSLTRSLMGTAPPETWSASSPLLWVGGGASSSSSSSGGSAAATAVPLPPLLNSQLRILSSQSFVKALAKASLSCRARLLKGPLTSRLLSPPSDDPEAATYATEIRELQLQGLKVEPGRDGSALAATPSLASSLLRGAVSSGRQLLGGLFSSGGGSSGGSTTSASTPKLPSPLAAALPALDAATTPFDEPAFTAFAQLFVALASQPRARTHASGGSEADAIVSPTHILNTLVFTRSLSLAWRVWAHLLETHASASAGLSGFVRSCFKSDFTADNPATAVLMLLTAVLAHQALAADDFELYGSSAAEVAAAWSATDPSWPLLLPLRELRHCIRLLRDVLCHVEGIGVDASSPDYATGPKGSLPPGVRLAAAPGPAFLWFRGTATRLLQTLHARHCQRPLGPSEMWLVDVNRAALTAPATPGAPVAAVSKGEHRSAAFAFLSKHMPFTVPFDQRVAAFNETRVRDLRLHQVGCPQVLLTVRSGPGLFSSAFDGLRSVRGLTLRRKVAVTFVSELGYKEDGIDAGGLFKELWTQLAEVVFNPGTGLWRVTPGGDLYPNPSSAVYCEIPDAEAFDFVGRLIGKALYEGITLGPVFAPFFLAKLLGRPVGTDALAVLDPQLYKSLMFLKNYDGDVADLCLTFSIAADAEDSGGGGGGAGGSVAEVELIPGGAEVPVTTANRAVFIHKAADYRLNRAIEGQTAALRRGLFEVLPPEWLTSFSPPELSILLSGTAAALDVDEWEAATAYTGVTAVLRKGDPLIRRFWGVVRELSPRDRAALLRFVTACPRPPPAGLRALDPPFTIQLAEGAGPDALPTASTCFHVLRLPPYPSSSVLKARLLTAIHSGAGFDLA